MYQYTAPPPIPAGMPLLSYYEAYRRAQLEHLARVANMVNSNVHAHPNTTTNPNASRSFIAPSPSYQDAINGTSHNLAVGGPPSVKIHVEYTVPLNQTFAQLPFAPPQAFPTPWPVPVPVPVPMHSAYVPSGIAPHALTAPQARTGTIINANVGAVPPNPTVAKSAQVASSDRPADEQQREAERVSSTSRPDTSLVPLPRPAVLRDAAESMHQTALQAQGPTSQSVPREELEPMQVDEDTQPDIASSLTVDPVSTNSEVDSESSPSTTNPAGISTPTSDNAAAAPSATPSPGTAESPVHVKTELTTPTAASIPAASTPTPASKRKKALHPERHKHKIRSTKHHTRWYATRSLAPIPAPPDFLRPTHGFLYVHTSKRARAQAQVWMYYAPDRMRRGEGVGAGAGAGSRCRSELDKAPLRLLTMDGAGMSAGADGCWVKVEEGHEHPVLEGYVLRMTEEDEPRWVKRASAAVYANRRRARERED